MNMTTGLKGLYKIGKKDSVGNVLAETGWIPNLITNFGLNSGFTSNMNTNWCAVGSGNTAPAFSDVQLVSQIGSRTNTVTSENAGNSGSPDYYYFRRRTFSFPLSSIIGNVAEVMLAASNTGANAFSRSLVKDEFGEPVTFPVLDGEQLYVIYELREYRNVADINSSIMLNGISYNYLLRACNIGNTASLFATVSVNDAYATGSMYAMESDVISPATGAPSTAGSSNSATGVAAAYVADTFYRDVTYIWSPPSANFTTGIGTLGIRAQSSNSTLKFALYFTSGKVPKLNTQTFSVTIRWTLTRV